MTELNPHICKLIVESRNKFRTLVDGIGDEIFSVGSDFNILTVNKALAESRCLHPREMIGLKCHLAIYGLASPCPEHGLPCPMLSARQSRKPETALHHLPAGKNDLPGSPSESEGRYIEIRAMPIVESSGEIKEVIVDRRDVTLQKLAEINIREHNERLECEVARRTFEIREANTVLTAQKEELARTNEELVNLQRLKEDLTSMVVHDLKGPLSEIQANLELLRTEPLSPFQEEFLEAAKMGGNELLRMITNLLDISRLEENRMVLEPEPLAARSVIESARERFLPLAILNQVDIRLSLPDELPSVMADRRLLDRILNNLISNALDFTPASGVITLHVSFSEPEFRFEVRDTGPGVPEDLRQKIFEKFSQGRNHDYPSRTSSGLGLTFCRLAVEAHGGRIWVESEEGRGSNFIFLIPKPQTPEWETEAWS